MNVSGRKTGLISSILLLAGAVLPIATLNNEWITIIPYLGNFTLGNEFWIWRDISAFAITYALAAVLIIYFSFRMKPFGLLICGSLEIIVSLLIFIALMMTASDLENVVDVKFNFGFGWIFVISGIIVVFISGNQLKEK